jgi:hypothetical protein
VELTDLMPQPLEYTIGGRALKFTPLTIGDLAALGNHIRQQRVRDFRAACEGMEAALIAAGLESIIKSDSDIDMRSPEAIGFLVHRSLKRLQPEITMEMVGDLLAVADLKEVLDLVNMLGGTSKN